MERLGFGRVLFTGLIIYLGWWARKAERARAFVWIVVERLPWHGWPDGARGKRHPADRPSCRDGYPTSGEKQANRQAAGSHSANGDTSQGQEPQSNTREDQAADGETANRHQPDRKAAYGDYAVGDAG
jgi:hypothetical protein